MSAPERVFLGWDRPILQQAAKRLLEVFGPSMGHVTVAVPGRRASRRLMELLTQAAPSAWIPPRLTTLTLMSRGAVQGTMPQAGPTLMALAWVTALQELSPEQLQTLATAPPEDDNLEAWLPMAEMLQSLHRELAAEAWTFAGVAEKVQPGDVGRWKVLAQLQQRYVDLLAEVDFADGDWLQLKQLESQFVLPPEQVLVVLGVTDAHPRQRRFLHQMEGQRQVWVAAPEELADGFDACGFVTTELWQERPLTIEDAQMVVCTTAEDQAKRLRLLLHEQRGKFAAEDITLGVLQPEHRAEIQQAFAADGVGVHDPEGIPGARTVVSRLLVALGDWLERPEQPTLAALLRHTDLAAWLQRLMERPVDLAALDAYQQEHLDRNAGPQWLDPVEPHVVADAQHAAVRTQAAVLWKETASFRGAPRTLADWAPIVSAWLQQVYAEQELDRRKESERRLAATLECCAEILMSWRRLPMSGAAARTMRAKEMLHLFLRELGAFRVPPQTIAAATLETGGWLELALDDAPFLALTDFQEGLVPAAMERHALLDANLCDRLSLSGDTQRWARDRYWLECMLQTRAQAFPLHLFLCRITSDGQPLLPSRFLFLDADAEAMSQRAVTLFARDPELPRVETLALPPHAALPGPRDDLEYEIEAFSASRLNRYLDTPYTYYLEHVLHLVESDDQAREMDPLLFGNLLHRVLERFGEDAGMRALEEADAIEAAVLPLLDQEAVRQFGEDPPAAVRLQLASARTRLHHFAQRQAELMEDGWRIQQVEWSPDGGSVPLEFEGVSFRLRGKVDRIDKREKDGVAEWRIFDYKTGDKKKEAKTIFQKQKQVWRDVQMALYPQLARPLTGGRGVARKGGNIHATYWNLGASEDHAGFTDLYLDEGMEELLHQQVAAAVLAIREGRFFDADQSTRHRSDFAKRCMGDGFLEELQDAEGGA